MAGRASGVVLGVGSQGRGWGLGLLAAALGAGLGAGAAAPARAQTPAPVQVRFSATLPDETLFPSDVFTELERDGLTQRRVALPEPLPNCKAKKNADACAALAELNVLDGFNLQPRLVLPFSGAVDATTVTSQSVFLLNLGSVAGGGAGSSERIGINQIVLNPAKNTVFAESDALLEQGSRYALVVTRGVRDATGTPLARLDVDALRTQLAVARPGRTDLADGVARALVRLRAAGVDAADLAGLSVFTAQSATVGLERMRQRLDAEPAAPADFGLAAGSSERAVFPLADVTGIVFRRQVTTKPTFDPVPLPIARLQVMPGAVARVAFGRFRSPSFARPDVTIQPLRGRDQQPVVDSTRDVGFNLFLPAGPMPERGWPVAIFGHAFGLSKNEGPLSQAAMLAANGVATIAINALGHGGGPQSSLIVSRTGAADVSVPAGGLSSDVDGDGKIGLTEGSAATSVLGARDGLRQTAVDLMQLVRVIQAGVDVDGDGGRDLDPDQIGYLGQSYGGIYGALFLATEPSVGTGVLNVTGGPLAEIGRFASSDGQALVPLRGAAMPTVIDDPAKLAMQEDIDRAEWMAQSASPVAYAEHLRRRPLAGVPAKRILFQFAKADLTIPNPTSTAMLRAGALRDRATFLRTDLMAEPDRTGDFENPHTFLSRIDATSAAVAQVARQAQLQSALFLRSDGRTLMDPDGSAPLFETPIQGDLPEGLGLPDPMMMPPPPPPAGN